MLYAVPPDSFCDSLNKMNLPEGPNISPPSVPPKSPQMPLSGRTLHLCTEGQQFTSFQWKTKSPLQARYHYMTDRTMRLVRPECRTKREGREVAGVRRLGVLHCHSTIIETVRTQSKKNSAAKLAWRHRMKPWWYCVLICTHCKYKVSYTTIYICREVKPAFEHKCEN